MTASGGPGWAFRVTGWAYRALLRLYPRSFRHQYADAMFDVYRERWLTEDAHRRPGRALRVWWLLARDLARSLPAEHRNAWRARPARSNATRPHGGATPSPGEAAHGVVRDLIYSLRGMARAPGFTVLATLTLALGIGTNSAIFTVIDDLILDPLPFDGADRLVYVVRYNAGLDARINADDVAFAAWRERATSFDALEAYEANESALTGGDRPLVVSRLAVTPTFMSALGIRAVVGRGFVPDDAAPSSPRVAVLSEGLWTLAFGADPEVVGRNVVLDDTVYTVIGVQPGGFQLPLTARGLQIWTPLAAAAGGDGDARSVGIIGRLKPGITAAQAQAELSLIQTDDPLSEDWTAQIVRPGGFLGASFSSGLWILFGAVGFVLLIACGNVANMILAKGVGRAQEIGVRMALGAGRPRVARLLLFESLLVWLLGGAAALLFAHWALEGIIAFRPARLDSLAFVGLDRTTLVFTLGVSLLTGLVFGLVTAVRLSRPGVAGALRAASRTASGGRDQRLLRQGLVTVQVALALVLFVGAGLMVRSFYRLQHVDPGFDPANLGTLRITLPEGRYPDAAQQRLFYDQLLEAIRGLPGVESAVATTGVPPRLSAWLHSPIVEGADAAPQEGARELTSWVAVTPGYFQTVGTPILRGRPFSEDDLASAGAVAVINEAFVRRFFSREEPLGKRFRFSDESPWMTVIGVARDIKAFGLSDDPDRVQVYTLMREQGRIGQFAIRAAGDYQKLVPLLEERVWAMDDELPLREAVAVEDLLADSIARDQFTTTLFATFAALAMVLAAAGIYGVISLTVNQQARELGIRIALGAGSAQILRTVLTQGLRPVAIGIVIGLGASAGLGRVIAHLLFNQSPTDFATWTAVSFVLAGVAAAACYLPARRAMALDPVEALRWE